MTSRGSLGRRSPSCKGSSEAGALSIPGGLESRKADFLGSSSPRRHRAGVPSPSVTPLLSAFSPVSSLRRPDARFRHPGGKNVTSVDPRRRPSRAHTYVTLASFLYKSL